MGVFLRLQINPFLAALTSTSSAADAQRDIDATMGLTLPRLASTKEMSFFGCSGSSCQTPPLAV